MHVVKRGENLYRIGLLYGVSAQAIARRNGIDDVTTLAVGTRLRIPNARGRPAQPTAARRDIHDELRESARREAQVVFGWPLRGTITSPYGLRGRSSHEGIDIAAPRGTTIRAAEAGKVIRSGWLGDFGRVVVIKHSGRYSSVYAHANTLLVREDQFVEKGDRIAEVGTSGNASGPHLHFEIRRGESARDPMAYLPQP